MIKIKKSYTIMGIVLLLILIGWIFVKFVIGGNEDNWIRDEKGIYVKHGNPKETPGYVLWQRAAIACASDKFTNFTEEKESQCLGICGNYAIDLVHVPRSEEDNKPENQCSDYGNGIVNHFIELDKNGEIVRVV